MPPLGGCPVLKEMEMISAIFFLAAMYSFGTKHWIIGIALLIAVGFAFG
jgi:hypothetical protein